jgi:hypothetical protein
MRQELGVDRKKIGIKMRKREERRTQIPPKVCNRIENNLRIKVMVAAPSPPVR